jgi:spore maturation protein CgeB
VVAGPLYPGEIVWPRNVERIEHLSPGQHRLFYSRQRFTLNITRADMIAAGYSPSVRLFEAAACGTPIMSDYWKGLDELFTPGSEVLIAESTDDVLRILRDTSLADAMKMGEAARQRVLGAHTAAHRAAELEGYLTEMVRTHKPQTQRMSA